MMPKMGIIWQNYNQGAAEYVAHTFGNGEPDHSMGINVNLLKLRG